MKKILLYGIGLLVLFLATLMVAQAKTSESGSFNGQKIIIGGTGDSQALLRSLARAFETTFVGSDIEVPDSIGSSGGIKALAGGRVDLARVARPLKEREKKDGFTYHLFAKSPVVFVVHPSVTGCDNLAYEQLIGIYTGKITNWEQLGASDGKIYAITREPGDSILGVLNKQIPGFKDITKPAAKVIYSTPETVEALANHRNTFGFLSMSARNGTDLRIVKVKGIYPSPENVTAGKYNLITPFAIVYKGQLTGLAKAFVDFLHSEKGRKIISEFGAIPS